MSDPTEYLDPLHPRQRPGLRVEAEVATWESVVFAISVGSAVRYLEVPAAQVPPFLEKVDSGELDDELEALATTRTGATLNMPGRIRTLGAFDRLVRGAVARAERDPLSGELTGPGWRPRKRRRDDRSRSDPDRQPDLSSRAGAPHAPTHPPAVTPMTVGSAAGPAVAPVVKAGWWSSPAVAVGAVVAVVVVVAAVVFAVARPGTDPEQAASVAAPPAATSAAVTSAEAPSAPGTSAASSSDAGSSTAVTSAAGTSAAGTSVAATAAPSATARPSGTGSGALAANPIAGSYSGVRTVTANSGHPEVPIGRSEPLDLTIAAACADPNCAVSVKGWGTAAAAGSTLKFSGTAAGPCPGSPGITVEDAWTVTLKAGPANASGAVESLTGVGTLTTSALNGCNGTVYPLTYSYSMTRS